MSFVETTCPKCRGKARRETDTMDTFFDSSWYFFRYASPEEKEFPLNPQAAAYWLPVDLYIGGVEHAILHLIYARFFTKVLRDLGLTSISEPFPHYLAQGMVTKDGAAMSKSRGNIVDPDEIIKKYGADALRVFILFASPPEKEFAWLEEGIEGCNKFLGRIWTFFHENKALFRQSVPGRSDADLPETQESYQRVLRKMHQAVKKVTEDVEKRFHLNTAISAIMEFYNQLKRERESLLNNAEGRALMEEALEKLILLLSLFAPHICEELWERAGHKTILARTPWPDYDPDLVREDMVTIVVQVNGKVRERFEAPADLAEADMEKEALELSRIRDILSGKKVIRVICVKNKLVNIVVEMER
jgi:leucyl-tRNA synthetase